MGWENCEKAKKSMKTKAETFFFCPYLTTPVHSGIRFGQFLGFNFECKSRSIRVKFSVDDYFVQLKCKYSLAGSQLTMPWPKGDIV